MHVGRIAAVKAGGTFLASSFRHQLKRQLHLSNISTDSEDDEEQHFDGAQADRMKRKRARRPRRTPSKRGRGDATRALLSHQNQQEDDDEEGDDEGPRNGNETNMEHSLPGSSGTSRRSQPRRIRLTRSSRASHSPGEDSARGGGQPIVISSDAEESQGRSSSPARQNSISQSSCASSQHNNLTE